MIGNDIIDLKLALSQSNWQRKGFLNKIFTEEEQSIIVNSENPFQMVWQFWSMKESAYKAYIQKHQNRFFVPKKFKCQLISKTEGTVLIKKSKYKTESKISNDFIHTIATLESSNTIFSDSFEIENDSYKQQSKISYKQLKAEVSKKMDLPIEELYIKKNVVGIPKLYHNNVKLNASFSISHHGKYGAYSLLNTL